MTEPERSKKLKPRMTHGGIRFYFVLSLIVAVLQLVRLAITLATATEWTFGDYLSLALLILVGIVMAYLLHVRREDRHFWEEDQAKTTDWGNHGPAP